MPHRFFELIFWMSFQPGLQFGFNSAFDRQKAKRTAASALSSTVNTQRYKSLRHLRHLRHLRYSLTVAIFATQAIWPEGRDWILKNYLPPAFIKERPTISFFLIFLK